MALTAAQAIQSLQDLIHKDATIGSSTFIKTDLNSAIAAADTWCTNNSASFVAALPEPFKSNSTPAQKALLLSIVALRRWGG